MVQLCAVPEEKENYNVGIGERLAGASASSPASISTTFPRASATSTSIPAAPQPTHGITNNSAFAAVSSGGNRYVFFQDISGSLRQAYYLEFSPLWTTGKSTIVPNTGNPMINTPIAAITDDVEITLLYIANNNSIAMQVYSNGVWDADYSSSMINLGNYATAPNTTSLSTILVPNVNSTQALVLFEDPESNMKILQGSRKFIPGSEENSFGPWIWRDITVQLSLSAPLTGTLSSPFTAGLIPTSSSNGTATDDLQVCIVSAHWSTTELMLSTFNVSGDGKFITSKLYVADIASRPKVISNLHSDLYIGQSQIQHRYTE
ncbi:hypothetical protein MMC15_007551 [Xylographa vitiligo]|nr:hypothetical protein [Xylographa vitiligo]